MIPQNSQRPTRRMATNSSNDVNNNGIPDRIENYHQDANTHANQSTRRTLPRRPQNQKSTVKTTDNPFLNDTGSNQQFQNNNAHNSYADNSAYMNIPGNNQGMNAPADESSQQFIDNGQYHTSGAINNIMANENVIANNNALINNMMNSNQNNMQAPVNAYDSYNDYNNMSNQNQPAYNNANNMMPSQGYQQVNDNNGYQINNSSNGYNNDMSLGSLSQDALYGNASMNANNNNSQMNYNNMNAGNAMNNSNGYNAGNNNGLMNPNVNAMPGNLQTNHINNGYMNDNMTASKKSNPMIKIGIIGILAVVAIGILIGYMFMNKDSNGGGVNILGSSISDPVVNDEGKKLSIGSTDYNIVLSVDKDQSEDEMLSALEKKYSSMSSEEQAEMLAKPTFMQMRDDADGLMGYLQVDLMQTTNLADTLRENDSIKIADREYKVISKKTTSMNSSEDMLKAFGSEISGGKFEHVTAMIISQVPGSEDQGTIAVLERTK